MKILEKAVMANGIEIQLEDWSDRNTEKYPDLEGLTIMAYPISKNTGKYRWIQGGLKFALIIPMNNSHNYTNDRVRADFEALKKGKRD